MNAPSSPLVFAHIGDTHLTDSRQRGFQDFLAVVAQIEVECGRAVDFVFLPGDVADNGLPAQYALAATALKMLGAPVHAVPGDHDMEQGSLANFYSGLDAPPLPFAVEVRGTRCLFLDICGPGSGGPDFRLGRRQLDWLERQLDEARGRPSLIFTHAYPDDLKGDGETDALNRLIGAHDVALVEMGHTHYNELANDGRTIFAAARSTTQIEEGPVGYALGTLDDGIVSWRFKALDDAFPFVMITAPADYRLMRGRDQLIAGETMVRALVFGRRNIQKVSCRVEGGEPIAMTRNDRVWTALVPLPDERIVEISVEAIDETGRPGQHTIRAATPGYRAPERARDGSDAASIGAWPENGVFGTQLGPNRNARPVHRPKPPR